MTLKTNFNPPAGWTKETIPDTECSVYTAPNKAGMVSVDFDGRCFRPGYSTTGKTVSRKPYAGREWRERICADAVSWLTETLK